MSMHEPDVEAERSPPASAPRESDTPAPAGTFVRPRPGALGALGGADPTARAGVVRQLQGTTGNALVARAIQSGEGVLARRVPTGTVQSEGSEAVPIEGAVIRPGAETDPEVLREQRIARAVPQVTQQARIRLLEARNQVTSGVESFRDYATSQIDAMDDAPSGYWGLIGAGVGLVGGIVSAAFPAAAIGIAIATAIQAAVQTQATEEATDELERRKNAAKDAMRTFANQTRDGFDAGVERLVGGGERSTVHQQIWNLSLTDDEVRMQLESGQEGDLNALCDRAGVPDPAGLNLFGQIVTSLNSRFGEWMGQQRFAQDHTRFQEMVAEANPHHEWYRERQQMMAEGRQGGEQAAQQAIEARRRAGGAGR